MPNINQRRWFIIGAALLGLAHTTAAAPPPPGIVIEAFDLFDTSIDHRAVVIAEQKRWLAAGAAHLAARLDANSRIHVIATPASGAMIAAIAHDYQHPSTCRRCIMAAARKLGARYVFIGSVHKVSDLIIYMRGELDRVGDPNPLMVKSMEVKADDRSMIRHASATMARAILRRLG